MLSAVLPAVRKGTEAGQRGPLSASEAVGAQELLAGTLFVGGTDDHFTGRRLQQLALCAIRCQARVFNI